MSNLQQLRIIINRDRCRKWKLKEVAEKLEQESWAGFVKGDADVWRIY
jgi:hypothetical protein